MISESFRKKNNEKVQVKEISIQFSNEKFFVLSLQRIIDIHTFKENFQRIMIEAAVVEKKFHKKKRNL